MKIGRYFSKEEFACKCGCGEDFEMDPNLIGVLDQLRFDLGSAVHINSGYRCKEHNESLGSKETSQHRKGTAADVSTKLYPPKQIADMLEKQLGNKGGLGRYTTFTHVDTRTRKARWGKN